MPATFSQVCPVCGRKVHVSVNHAKLTVVCQHCHAAFLAHDPQARMGGSGEQSDSLLLRADRLLAILAGKAEFAGAS